MNFFQKIYWVVKKIPQGHVATYGQIGKRLKVNPRTIGWALHANKDPKIPCHRVVGKDGRIAENYAFGGWREQRRKLYKEGIKVKGRKVNLGEYQWRV